SREHASADSWKASASRRSVSLRGAWLMPRSRSLMARARKPARAARPPGSARAPDAGYLERCQDYWSARDVWSPVGDTCGLKLKDYARQQGVRYRSAWRWWKAGKLPGQQLDTGTILLEPAAPPPSGAAQGVALDARVSSAETKSPLYRPAERLAAS